MAETTIDADWDVREGVTHTYHVRVLTTDGASADSFAISWTPRSDRELASAVTDSAGNAAVVLSNGDRLEVSCELMGTGSPLSGIGVTVIATGGRALVLGIDPAGRYVLLPAVVELARALDDPVRVRVTLAAIPAGESLAWVSSSPPRYWEYAIDHEDLCLTEDQLAAALELRSPTTAWVVDVPLSSTDPGETPPLRRSVALDTTRENLRRQAAALIFGPRPGGSRKVRV